MVLPFKTMDYGVAGTEYTAGTGVTINASNEISIGQSVGTSDTVEFNQVQAPTIVYDDKFSTDYRTIERCGSVDLAAGVNTTIATFLSNVVTDAWRSVELIMEESHTPANGSEKGGGLWVGCFTYKFDTDGTRQVSVQSFFRSDGHGGGISIDFDPITNTGAASGARLRVFNFKSDTNSMRFKFRFHSMDAYAVSTGIALP